MKNKNIILILIVSIILCMFLITGTGCQCSARSFGGDTTIELEPNEKLELITWKDDDLWYLTRPMRENEVPEVHTYKQSSNFGFFEGTVTIIESR